LLSNGVPLLHPAQYILGYRQRLKRAAKASKRCGKQNWATPHQLFDALHKEFHFQTDVCAEAENAKLPTYYNQATDGLVQEWSGVCWMNPPYGETGKWMKKAYESAQAGATVVCLVPVDTSTKWWWEYCSRAAEIRFIVGRLKFIDTGAVIKRIGRFARSFENCLSQLLPRCRRIPQRTAGGDRPVPDRTRHTIISMMCGRQRHLRLFSTQTESSEQAKSQRNLLADDGVTQSRPSEGK
jgi:phage N-6-adenine-methyltransferase